MRFSFLLSLILVFNLVIVSGLYAENLNTNVLLLLDCSERMSNNWTTMPIMQSTAIELKKALQKISEQPQWGFNVGLRVFGDQNPAARNDCEDTRLVVPIEWLDPTTLGLHIENLKPKGKAPLSSAIRASGADLTTAKSKAFNHVLILTAGTDGCNSDEIAAITSITKEKLQVDTCHVFGLNLQSNSLTDWQNIASKCQAEFKAVSDPNSLSQILIEVFESLMKPKPDKAE